MSEAQKTKNYDDFKEINAYFGKVEQLKAAEEKLNEVNKQKQFMVKGCLSVDIQEITLSEKEKIREIAV